MALYRSVNGRIDVLQAVVAVLLGDIGAPLGDHSDRTWRDCLQSLPEPYGR